MRPADIVFTRSAHSLNPSIATLVGGKLACTRNFVCAEAGTQVLASSTAAAMPPENQVTFDILFSSRDRAVVMQRAWRL